MRAVLGFAILIFVLPSEGLAAESTPPKYLGLRARLEESLQRRTIPSISIAIVQHGKVVWLEALGLADVERHQLATPDTTYRVGSLCKSVTGTVLTVAQQDGDIDLSRPVTDFLPRLSEGSDGRFKRTSLSALLDMAAGMTQTVHYRGLENDSPDLTAQALSDGYSLAPVHASRRYSYSNMGPDLAARALASATREEFAHYAYRKVLRPLGMTSTLFTTATVSNNRQAQSYKQSLSPFDRAYEVDPAPGAGCVTSARDLSKYMLFHLGETSRSAPLTRAGLKADHTPKLVSFYRRGWGRVMAGNQPILISDGQVAGGEAVILLDPAKKAGVAVLTNVANDVVYEIAAAGLEPLDPGVTKAFQRGFADLRAARAKSVEQFYPASGMWKASGALLIDRKAHAVTLTSGGSGLLLMIDGGAPIAAKPEDRDDGYAKWAIPCLDLLPLCIAGTDADAHLLLTRDRGGLAGVVTVDSRLGLFPYELDLRP